MSQDIEALARLQRALASRLVGQQRDIGCSLEESLAELDSQEIERSAQTLVRKRLSQTSALLPLTKRLLRSQFDKDFVLYAQTIHFNGREAAFSDGAAFSEWLRARWAYASNADPHRLAQLEECCRFEGGWCAWRAARWVLLRDRFEWDWSVPLEAGIEVDFAAIPRKPMRRWLWRFGPWRGMRLWSC